MKVLKDVRVTMVIISAALLGLPALTATSAALVHQFAPPSEALPLTPEAIQERKDVEGHSDGEREPTGQERVAAAALAAQEAAIVEANSPAVLFEASHDADLTLPPMLAAAEVDELTSAVLPKMRPASIRSEGSFEEVYYTDGIGSLLVSWQVWPLSEDPSIAIPAESIVVDLGNGIALATTEADLGTVSTTEARVFDGELLVSVVLIDDTGGEIKDITKLATELIDRIRGA